MPGLLAEKGSLAVERGETVGEGMCGLLLCSGHALQKDDLERGELEIESAGGTHRVGSLSVFLFF